MKKLLSMAAVLLMALPLSGCGPFDYEIEEVSNEGSSAYYEIFVASFYDGNGDGMGDFKGVEAKLDYLQNLGIGGIWFMPIMPSYSYHKYDVRDYYAIDASYGTMADFESYLAQAHAHNIKTIIDLVVNHTASTHPWFLEGVQEYKNGLCSTETMEQKCNYYNFSHTYKAGYNQYGITNTYYESQFQSGMPDLNLDNPYVRDEIEAIMEFWLNKGVDGFRLDAVTSYYTGFPSKNIEFMTWLNDTAEAINPNVYIVAEGPWSGPSSASDIQSYYQSGIESVFNFTLAQTGGKVVYTVNPGTGNALSTYVANYDATIKAINPDAIDAPFLSNHDLGRSAGYFFGENAAYKLKVAAEAYLLLPGRPFIYYGEEIGMKGSGVDENKRLPMIWSSTDTTGKCNPPVGATYPASAQITLGVEDQLAIPDSQINHYRKVISLRNKYNAYFTQGAVEALSADPAVFAMQYSLSENDRIWVLMNFSAESVTTDYAESMKIVDEVRTLGEKAKINKSWGTPKSITIPGFSVVILHD